MTRLQQLKKQLNEASENLNISDVIVMLSSDSKIEELIRSRSQLYTSYSVKDKEGKYRGVVDIQSVVELLRQVLGN